MIDQYADVTKHKKTYDYITAIEVKILPSKNGRNRDESPMSVLTKEERDDYAEYLLEAKNQPQAAQAFRNYQSKPKTPKDVKKGSKQAQMLKKEQLSNYEMLLLKPKETVALLLYKKSTLDELNQDELKVLLKFVEDYNIKGKTKPDTLQRSYRAQVIELIKEKINV